MKEGRGGAFIKKIPSIIKKSKNNEVSVAQDSLVMNSLSLKKHGISVMNNDSFMKTVKEQLTI